MSRITLQWQQLTQEQFLAEYWQKKPLLMRQALPEFQAPISVDEVAGLALEDDIESRLIWEKHPKTKNSWVLEQGPFSDTQLQQLPNTGWSLLVQGIDQWVPEVASLLRNFDFLPQWRFEDIMISVAPQGGSVGPHSDQYDVFLCQVEGERLWQWSHHCVQGLKLRPDTPLNILEEPLPEPTSSALLQPGDILYLPPGIAHHGIAQSLSQTWSVGFRAPDIEEILSVLSQRIAVEADADLLRYADPDLTLGESQQVGLNSTALNRIKRLILQCLDRPEVIADVLGALVTRQSMQYHPYEANINTIQPTSHDTVAWAMGTRKTHFENRLYVNGATFELPTQEQQLMTQLMNLGAMSWTELYQIAQTEQGQIVLNRLWDMEILIPATAASQFNE